MVQGLGFLSKKSWHTKNLANQEKVWMAEQRSEAEAQKTKELAKQIQQEREQEELDKISGKKGPKLDRGIDWMYQGPRGDLAKEEAERQAEECLMGKEYVAEGATVGDFDNGDKDQGIHTVIKAPQDAAVAAASAFVDTEPTVKDRNEDFRLRVEDPMFLVSQKQREKEMRHDKTKALYERVVGYQEEEGDEKVSSQKKSKKEKKRHKKKHKKSNKRRHHRDRDYDSEIDDDYSSEEEEKDAKDRHRSRRSPSPDRHRSKRHKRSRSNDRHHRRDTKSDDDDDSRSSSGRRRRDDRYHHRDRHHKDDRSSSYHRGHKSSRRGGDRSDGDSDDNSRGHRRREDHDRRRDYDDDDRDSTRRRSDTRHHHRERHDARPPRNEDRPHHHSSKPAAAAHASSNNSPPSHDGPKRDQGYGLVKGGAGGSTTLHVDRDNLGPNQELLQKKREERDAERRRIKEMASTRRQRTDEERQRALEEMQANARKREEARSRPESSNKRRDDSGEEEHPRRGDASFLHDITRQSHGIDGNGHSSLSARVAQNRHTNQRLHDSFF